MPTFTYRAVSATGESQTGTMDAPDRRVVMQRLRAKQMRPVDVTMKGGGDVSANALAAAASKDITFDAPTPARAAGRPGKPGHMKILDPVEFKGDKVALAFLKKLFQLHSGGMPLGDAIRLLSVRVTDPRQASLAARLWKDLSEGRTLANSFRNYPGTFDTATVHLVEAGETTGNLVPVLENLINHLEEQGELRKKILGGLAYPAFICTLAFGVVCLFLFFLLPRIRTMMASMGGQMTFMTKLLVGMSEYGVRWGWLVVLAIVGFAIFVFQWRKKPEGRTATDSWALRLPLLKRIFLNADICRVSNLCATLLESGVNTTEALKMTEKSISNVIVQSRFSSARMLINDGASFSNSFRHFHVLPDLDLDLLAVGENTGNIAKSFREIYKTHSREMSEQFTLLTVMISSIALGFAFSLVAILALGIVSSVLAMSASLEHQGNH